MRAKLLAPALRPSSARAIAPKSRTYATEPKPQASTKDAPAVPLTSDSTQIREENAAEGMRHQPDYNVAVDYRTSYVLHEVDCTKRFLANTADSNFSPVPKRVMDGSEPGESVAAAVLSGAPVDLQARTVRYGTPSTCILSMNSY
jgi:NADH dehydrogenase (ubiquinone) Fe-S protein 4